VSTIAAVIPVHNKGPHIARALRSALSQPVDEIVVVDDACSDDSMAVVASFGDPRIRVLRRETPGPGGYAARNLAIESSDSDWIAFLDADDAWEEGYVETLRRIMGGADAGVGAIYAARRVVGMGRSDFIQTGADTAGEPRFDFDAFLDLWLRMSRCPIWTSSSAFKRDVLIEAGLFPADRCVRGGDKDMWLRAMSRTAAIATPFVGATYYNDDVVNQVTRQTSLNTQHCMCSTLTDLIATSDGARRRKLKLISNLEMRHYAQRVFGKEKMSRDVFKGFYVEESPALYAMLVCLTLTPLPLQRMVRSAAKGV
jgi:succinoglycan biosynthesis protein ExoO